MLKLKNITKKYVMGAEQVDALNGVSINFRKNEFVSILGPSGCGKTTLLNIIGGLDQYTSGELIIRGKSTKNFTDRALDAYRNHSIGFVFQSYNLIPHQTVIANVELALTLSGVSKSERRRRAKEALEKVGLGSQLNKKPNQMSGGQMQRVAIARALVNNPDILLADEPTGALDSETSVQIMDILREIARDKLVIMVTHNPDLAAEYSTRIIKLIDGKVISDTAPYEGSNEYDNLPVMTKKEEKRANRLKSMSFFTALSLSLNNLFTKKTRTFMTSIAGSIGIIGIALILSVSTGVNAFIGDIQNETLIAYPLTINSESDAMSVLAKFMGAQAENAEETREEGYVYSRNVLYDMMSSISEKESNNLEAFKKFIESSDDMKNTASFIKYEYNVGVNVYTKDPDGHIVSSDMSELMENMYSDAGMSGDSANFFASSDMVESMSGGMAVWQEMLPGKNGELISEDVMSQYEVIYGSWPQKYDEAVIVVNSNGEISDYILYSLGLKPYSEMMEIMMGAVVGDKVETDSANKWSFEDICKTEYKLIMAPDRYQENADGTYTDLSATETGMEFLYSNPARHTPIKIVGIISPAEDATSPMLTGAVAYTSALTEYIMDYSDNSELVNAQLENLKTDIISGKPFKPETVIELTDAQKSEKIRNYFTTLSEDEKAELYLEILCTPTDVQVEMLIEQYLLNYTRQELEALILQVYAEQMGTTDTDSILEYFKGMSDEEFYSFLKSNAAEGVKEQYKENAMTQFVGKTDAEIIAAFEYTEHSEADFAYYYDNYMPDEYASLSYEDTLEALGYINRDRPKSISIYVDTFEAKDKINEIISSYNDSVGDADKIKYTDYFAIMMSSVSTVLDAISYVLIAFVTISLVVSSIMIGIITYTSVLERTKEIGILRAIGASKRDVSRVFNAETVSIGFAAGVLGIIISVLLTIPINIVIHNVTGFNNLSAQLPTIAGIVLVAISVFLTFIAGLVPSGIAAKKDPVVALRSE